MSHGDPPLTKAQVALIERPLDLHLFLHGPAGCGKTRVGLERMLFLMQQGVPGSSILVVVPQRTLAAPYLRALETPGVVAGGPAPVVTVGGLAQRMVDLFWPMVAEQAGFTHPERPPVFLTLETAQYYLAHLLLPLWENGLFDSVVIDRNRLYSQVIDNLNKAAAVGFPYTQIGERLKSAWAGPAVQLRIYEDAQTCANLFRQYCLEHNLLDFSLQIEVFFKHLWNEPLCRDYLHASYRHLIYDNVEEDTPVAHDLVREWLPSLESAMLIYDQEAGYRSFLGADPQSALDLSALCGEQASLADSFINPPEMIALGHSFRQAMMASGAVAPDVGTAPSSAPAQPKSRQAVAQVLAYEYQRFYPQMLDWTAQRIAALVLDEGVAPGEIAVLAPFLSDALRYSLGHRLESLGIPVRSHRPSRSLRDEPATQCLLTLACLANADWGITASRFDLAYALLQAIDGIDLVRARLLADAVYSGRSGKLELLPFEQLASALQERITYRVGERYETLRRWLLEYQQGPQDELDVFLSRLFGEVLSQPGFGFHTDYSAGEVAANLVESVQKFRWAAGQALAEEKISLGKEFLHMVQEGVIAAQYIRSWQEASEEAVFLAPAYTYLMSNRPVDYQFWLDAGSRGWFERLYQPLTHPYVLSRHWPAGKPWSDADEVQSSHEALYRLTQGLLRRCRRGIFLGLSELGEQGYEQRGPLLRVLQRILSS